MKKSTHEIYFKHFSWLTVTLFVFGSYFTVQAQNPVLYGLTYYGGNTNYGAIISFNPTTKTEAVEWSFGTGSDGQKPNGELVYDSVNSLYYGTSVLGGATFDGAIYTFNPSNNQETLVFSFSNTFDAALPEKDIVYDPVNKLYYGLASEGGTNMAGAVYDFNTSNNFEHEIWNFGGPGDGSNPEGNFVYDTTDGLFYGMTNAGGSHSKGTIVSFNPANNTEAVLWSFGDTTDGNSPKGSLVFNSNDGLYYGMTYGNGISTTSSEGAIITFDPVSKAEAVVYTFKGSPSDGSQPYGNLVYDAATGLYYGLTTAGGTADSGAIISFNPSTKVETLIWSFGTGTDGWYPLGDLVYNPYDSLYYGTADLGGTYSKGTIFTFNPRNNAEKVVWSFGNGSDGYMPHGNLSVYNQVSTSVNKINSPALSVNAYPNPCNGVFQLQLSNSHSSEGLVEVYNMLGERVYSGTYQQITQSPFTIDLSSQPNGIYLYRVVSKTGKMIGEGKVVVQK
jgi:uncharacterized repeat protein (TIGR03803 family)